MAVEIPYIIAITSVSFLTLYWASGLNKQNSADSGFYLWLAMTIFTAYCVAFGQSVAAVCTHIIQAITLLPIVVVFLFLFCGVLNPPDSMPEFWYVFFCDLQAPDSRVKPTSLFLSGTKKSTRDFFLIQLRTFFLTRSRSSWMYPLVPTRYYLEGVVSNVLVGVTIECTEDDVSKFLPPPNMTCGAYAADFLVNNTGYIINPNATQPELCGYCQYERGADYYETFVGWDYSYRWRDLGIVVCYWFAAVLVTIVFTWVNRKGMR